MPLLDVSSIILRWNAVDARRAYPEDAQSLVASTAFREDRTDSERCFIRHACQMLSNDKGCSTILSNAIFVKADEATHLVSLPGVPSIMEY